MTDCKNLISSPTHFIELDTHKLRYEVIYSKRKTIQLVLKAADHLVIKAPKGVDLGIFAQLVIKRRKWLLTHVERLKANPYAERPRFEDGSTHYLLGQPYALSLQTGAIKRFSCAGDRFLVTAPDIDCAETLLYRYYSAQAKTHFPRRLAELWREFTQTAHKLYHNENWLNHAYPSLTTRRMKSRFGSMTIQNKLTLNTELIRVSPRYIDYVILHELCHLKHMNHSKNFYDLLETLCPHWKAQKQELQRLLPLG